jgi:hypothetical protein
LWDTGDLTHLDGRTSRKDRLDQQPPQATPQVADGLAYVCRHLDTLRTALRHGQHHEEEPAALQQVLEAARTLADLTGPLQALHTALLKAGDTLGIWGAARREVTLAGDDHGVPFEPVYRCPLGRCTGRHPDNTTIFPLICTITGRELHQETL